MTFPFSSKHYCAQAQHYSAASMTVDSFFWSCSYKIRALGHYPSSPAQQGNIAWGNKKKDFLHTTRTVDFVPYLLHDCHRRRGSLHDQYGEEEATNNSFYVPMAV